MNKISTSILCVFFLLLGVACTTEVSQKDEMVASDNSQLTQPDSVLRHVVLFKFKDDADPTAVKAAEDAFVALPAKIPEILDFEWGMNNSPEGLNKGLTHCYTLTFASEADRSVYLPHPDHQAFGALLTDILEDVTVVDYWTK